MNQLPLLYRGSVKDVRGIKGESPYIFEYSDRYSVFDWGNMPDELPGKGQALASIACMSFKLMDLPHHCLEQTSEKSISVRPVNIIHPIMNESATQGLSWDYNAYQTPVAQTLVPLEVIFRFGITQGSSLLKRENLESYARAIGLSNTPKVGDRFNPPMIEFSTKLESTDRYITHQNAKEIAHLNNSEFEDLISMTHTGALRLNDFFTELGIDLVDGKFEFAFNQLQENKNRSFMLVDSIGPDELRLIYKGKSLSKEKLREFYRNTSWYENQEKAKKIALERGSSEWKKICIEELKSTPPLLPEGLKESTSMIYKTIANCMSMKLFNKKIFEKAWTLDELAERL